MKLITSIQVKQADHTQVIDTAAAKVGSAANKAFLFIIDKEIQGWHNFTALCSWGLDRLGQKHGPIYAEVKGSAIAVYHKGCSQETVFVQGLIQTHFTDRLDAHWKLHDEAISWFKDQTNAFLDDQSVEESSGIGSEGQSSDITEEVVPVAEELVPDEIISEAEVDEFIADSPVPVFDPDPLDPDLLDDEMSIPEPTPVATEKTTKRRSTRKGAASLSSLMRQEAGKV